jgi:uncharacterized MAPEG superfamily protein
MLGVVGTLPNTLAMVFIGLRVVYVWLYVTGRQSQRSLVWVVALAVNVAIFLLPVFK